MNPWLTILSIPLLVAPAMSGCAGDGDSKVNARSRVAGQTPAAPAESGADAVVDQTAVPAPDSTSNSTTDTDNTPKQVQQQTEPAAPKKGVLNFATHVQPIFKERCTTCHYPGAVNPEADDDDDKSELVDLTTMAAVVENWDDISVTIGIGMMPPPEAPAITQEEIHTMSEWMKQRRRGGAL